MNEIEHDLDNEDKTLLYKTTPSTFIDRYCTKLNINQELTQLCKFIACVVEQKVYTRKYTSIYRNGYCLFCYTTM